MDPALAVKAAAALLLLAALVGFALAGIRLAGAPYPPAWLAMIHGFIAGAALTLLLFVGLTVGAAWPVWAATAVLLAAATVGVWLNLGFHARLRPIPLATMGFHTVIAMAGFVALVAALASA